MPVSEGLAGPAPRAISGPAMNIPEARALLGFPVPVWAARSFNRAAGQRCLGPRSFPLAADLRHWTEDPFLVIGTVTNRLPVPWRMFA